MVVTVPISYTSCCPFYDYERYSIYQCPVAVMEGQLVKSRLKLTEFGAVGCNS